MNTAGRIEGYRLGLMAGWLGLGGLLALLAGTLAGAHSYFSYDVDLADIPARMLAAGMMLAGLLYLAVPGLVRASLELSAEAGRRLLVLMIAVGFALRVALIWSEPALEDDYHRYLWDGAVTAHGLSPYTHAPAAAARMPEDSLLFDLSQHAGSVHDRINHPGLRTIYPPVAQAAFALAYALKPWSLIGWRLVCLGGEIATLILLIALLKAAGRAPLWSAVYWWNPVVIKELINSAHMEAVLMPLLLGALLLAVRGRHLLGIGALTLAAGMKLWPLMLAPLLLAPLRGAPARLVAGVAILAGGLALMALPILLAGIDQSSGFVAYAERWRTNSALFPALERGAELMASAVGLPWQRAGLVVRGCLALAVGALALWLARGLSSHVAMRLGAGVSASSCSSPEPSPRFTSLHGESGQGRSTLEAAAADLVMRAGLVTGALVLLSPAQFPWYLVWVVPFLAFRPVWGMLALTATIPIYYVSFHYLPRGTYQTFTSLWVWVIWVPVWLLLALEAWRAWTRRPTGVP